MGKNINESFSDKCKICGHEFDEGEKFYVALDIQKKKNKVAFCSYECMKKWINRKITSMCITLGIGLAMFIAFMIGGVYAVGLLFLFLPYMIRQIAYSFSDMFNSGNLGEAITIGVVIIGCLTIIYPVVKIIQEIREYKACLEMPRDLENVTPISEY